jgi:hypothetical protein
MPSDRSNSTRTSCAARRISTCARCAWRWKAATWSSEPNGSSSGNARLSEVSGWSDLGDPSEERVRGVRDALRCDVEVQTQRPKHGDRSGLAWHRDCAVRTVLDASWIDHDGRAVVVDAPPMPHVRVLGREASLDPPGAKLRIPWAIGRTSCCGSLCEGTAKASSGSARSPNSVVVKKSGSGEPLKVPGESSPPTGSPSRALNDCPVVARGGVAALVRLRAARSAEVARGGHRPSPRRPSELSRTNRRRSETRLMSPATSAPSISFAFRTDSLPPQRSGPPRWRHGACLADAALPELACQPVHEALRGVHPKHLLVVDGQRPRGQRRIENASQPSYISRSRP